MRTNKQRSKNVRFTIDLFLFIGYTILHSTMRLFMKIESRAIISRRIRNLEADIRSCRNSGNTLRLRILYSQLSQARCKLVAMKN